MELFLLALIGAVVAAEATSSSTALQPFSPEPEPEPDPDQLRALAFWNLIDQRRHSDPKHTAVPWTNTQDAAWMMDRLVCPEGHGEDHLMYIDELWWVGSPVRQMPTGEPTADLDKRESDSFSPMLMAPSIWCYHPQHQGPRGTTLPEHVWRALERDW